MKPMLGTTATRDELIARLAVGPLLGSSKLDGVRAIIKDGVVLSRSLKPIPNKYVQQWLGRKDLNGLDGELIVGEPTDRNVFRNTTSGVMSPEGEPSFTYRVFDLWDEPNTPFHNRVALLRSRAWPYAGSVIVPVQQYKLFTIEGVDAFFEEMLTAGYEGAVLRNPLGLYKYGRSTVKEAGLLKMKPFLDAEAPVVDAIELMHNENEAFTNELGRTSRSTAKAGKVSGGVLGALVCTTPQHIEFEIGTGFTAKERAEYWPPKKVIGRVAKYKYLSVGGYDKPRHAVFLGWRDRRDV